MASSIYQNARTDRQYKAATGLSKLAFEALYRVFAPYYEPKNESLYPNQPKPVLTDKREALFFILHYFKAYPTLQNIGMYFGFSDFAASVCLERLKPCLKAALNAQGIDKQQLFKNQEEFDQQFAGITDLVLDVTEVPIERASNQDIQREYYGGKKNFTP
ncbi:hypothetical protein [Hymenobacter psoromatis]|uniref:hypothetical protein n=1 Tax=Hymenobacter psoromatis TaxID=1484116 RepID=UPI001CBC1ACE|nr:hypothetical protein [Hymenobacter psoromatis]